MAGNVQCCFERYEKKYMLTPAQQRAMTAGARRYMKEDAHARYSIYNIYYDTDQWDLIRTSLEKPAYKEKLRVRSYGTPGPGDNVFVELKKKVDGVVYKRRVVMPPGQAARYLAGDESASPGGQISREIDWFQRVNRTRPRVFIGYDRAAFAGIAEPEVRMTFDTNLRWRDYDLDLRRGGAGMPLLPPDRVLMEIKVPGAAPLWLSRLLAQVGARPVSFSKYGTCFENHILTKKEFGHSA